MSNVKTTISESRRYNMLIDGQLVDGAHRMEVVNPATGKVFANCARADAAQLESAVAAAKAAFGAWSRKPIAERRDLLLVIAEAMSLRIAEFTELLVQEQGKPLAQAAAEIGGCIYMLRELSKMTLEPKLLVENDRQRIELHRAPLGVVAAIMPWNFPLIIFIIKLTPALLAGNTMVAKPAPTTPLTSLLFAEMVALLLPPGVLNVIIDQNDLGSVLAGHPDIAKVTLTGSTATGRKVMACAAGTLKRLTLELGGNDAAIVLDDVNVGEVAPKIFQGAMQNSGQICVAIKRLYVPETLYEEMCAALRILAERSRVGNGLDPLTEIGPLQNKAQFDRVIELLKDTKERGLIIAGGHALDRDGFFIAPTIVRDIADGARLVQEEQFAPILPVLKYSAIDDAIARANSTDFGLGGSVWSSDLAQAHEVAMKMSTGNVWINKSSDMSPDVPVGGAKQSGVGIELGQAGLEEFTQAKTIQQ